MKLRFVRERALAELRNSIGDNLERYRSGKFDELSVDPTLSFESGIAIKENILNNLRAPKGDKNYDSENCAVMLDALGDLQPYEAADERLWVMLSHTLLLKHARVRWPIPRKQADAVSHINTHFFAFKQRQIERDNVASRLWWMGHLCSRVQGLGLKASLEVMLHKSDVRANIIERPTTGQSIPVFSAVIRKLEKSYKGQQKLFERKTFRNLMIKLNGLGGYKLLDALDSKSVEGFIEKIITDELKIAQV